MRMMTGEKKTLVEDAGVKRRSSMFLRRRRIGLTAGVETAEGEITKEFHDIFQYGTSLDHQPCRQMRHQWKYQPKHRTSRLAEGRISLTDSLQPLTLLLKQGRVPGSGCAKRWMRYLISDQMTREMYHTRHLHFNRSNDGLMI